MHVMQFRKVKPITLLVHCSCSIRFTVAYAFECSDHNETKQMRGILVCSVIFALSFRLRMSQLFSVEGGGGADDGSETVLYSHYEAARQRQVLNHEYCAAQNITVSVKIFHSRNIYTVSRRRPPLCCCSGILFQPYAIVHRNI